MIYAALAAASFVYVFLKAFQQRSVAFDNYVAILPVSLGMAAMEVFTISQVANAGWHPLVVVSIGLASGSGAIAAMLLHRRIFHRRPPNVQPVPPPDLG